MRISSQFKAVVLFIAFIFTTSTIFAATPPGLSKSGHSPSGLQGKTPAGWSKGKKKGWYKTRSKKVKVRNPNATIIKTKTKVNVD